MAEPWTYERARAFFDPWAYLGEIVMACDLCGDQRQVEVLAERDRYAFPVTTVKCQSCGLVYQARPMAPAGLRALYSGPYRALVSAWHGREINAETLEPEQSAYGQRLGSTLVREWVGGRGMAPGRDRLLDLGGSTGMVAREVAASVGAHGITIVEPCTSEAVQAIHPGSRVVVQSAEDFDPGDERWDLVLLCQTVDHLRSISAVLRKVRGLLAPGGRFYVDAVDWEAVRGDGPAYMALKLDHIYSLTPETMAEYLRRAGFKFEQVPSPAPNHVGFLCEAA